MKEAIIEKLTQASAWKDSLLWFDTIDSTNTRAKELAQQGASHGTILIANQQTGGRGRLGRSFLSPKNAGIYLSIILRPDCMPGDLMHLTCAVGVAMCDAIARSAGFRPSIKWTNDLVYGQKKLGGILTELGLESDSCKVSYAVVGIGINCCQSARDFDPSIQDMAASLSMIAQHPIDRAAIAAGMIDALWKMDRCLLTAQASIMDRYRSDCMTIGQYISIHRGDTVRHGKAVSVDNQGALIVEFSDGHQESITSGEVSVRGMYGYV